MRKVILILFGAFALFAQASTAWAQPVDKRASSPRSDRIVQNFSNCLINRTSLHSKIIEFLTVSPASSGYERRARRILRLDQSCRHFLRKETLAIDAIGLRIALYDAAYRYNQGENEPLAISPQSYVFTGAEGQKSVVAHWKLEAFSAMSSKAACVVGADPIGSGEFVQTKAATNEEDSALKSLSEAFVFCDLVGSRFKRAGIRLRGTIAEQLFLLSSTAKNSEGNT